MPSKKVLNSQLSIKEKIVYYCCKCSCTECLKFKIPSEEKSLVDRFLVKFTF